MFCRPALAAVALLALVLAPAAAFADRQKVQRIPVRPPSFDRQDDGLSAKQGRRARQACLDVDDIVAAVVTSDRSVELSLRDGEIWHMRFASACPALSYYQGFYYHRTQAGKLCAGRDTVIARSGGECPIDILAKAKRKKAKKRQD